MTERTTGHVSQGARRKPILLVVALVLLALRPACAPSGALKRQPNILLISIDTLRADRLSSYGYERSTSPFVDGLAEQGIRFEHAYATSSWTTPSVVSMLTSTYPYRHRMGGRVRGVPRKWSRIPEDLPNLTSSLKDHGYRTYGLVANANLAADRGFDRGFDRYLCLGTADLDEVDAAITPWLDDIGGGDGPWFLWLHMLDPHGPYKARKPWIETFRPDYQRYPAMDGMRSETYSARAKKLSKRQMDVIRAIYDSEIRDTDEFLKGLFDRLIGAHEALVVFTSDHGEEFLEHGGVLHGRTLFEESIRIPFIVRLPDRRFADRTVERAVSLVDVLPTILRAAGIEPTAGAAGIDVVGTRGGSVPEGRVVVAELLRGYDERALTDGQWKLLHDARQPERPRLYDLRGDPAESVDLSDRSSDHVARFREILVAFEQAYAPTATPLDRSDITPEQLEALKALGYVEDD